MKRTMIIFCTLIMVCCMVMPLLPLSGEENIYRNTLRLHVLAHSDSEADQALKLKVRDALLGYIGELTRDCATRYEAQNTVADHTDELTSLAKKAVEDNGCSYPVTIKLGEEYYPTREYEGVRMPAGTYMSLRVLIGDGAGQNWWCVLYPPLCTSASKPQGVLQETGFTPDQIQILTEGESPRYRLKFRVLEILEQLFSS